MSTDLPSCTGLSDLFDATDPRSHANARIICSTCPVIAACRGSLLEARREQLVVGAKYGPEGTWAGILLSAKTRKKAVA